MAKDVEEEEETAPFVSGTPTVLLVLTMTGGRLGTTGGGSLFPAKSLTMYSRNPPS